MPKYKHSRDCARQPSNRACRQEMNLRDTRLAALSRAMLIPAEYEKCINTRQDDPSGDYRIRGK